MGVGLAVRAEKSGLELRIFISWENLTHSQQELGFKESRLFPAFADALWSLSRK